MLLQQEQELKQIKAMQLADYRSILDEQKIEHAQNKLTPQMKLNSQVYSGRTSIHHSSSNNVQQIGTP